MQLQMQVLHAQGEVRQGTQLPPQERNPVLRGNSEVRLGMQATGIEQGEDYRRGAPAKEGPPKAGEAHLRLGIGGCPDHERVVPEEGGSKSCRGRIGQGHN